MFKKNRFIQINTKGSLTFSFKSFCGKFFMFLNKDSRNSSFNIKERHQSKKNKLSHISYKSKYVTNK